MTLVSLVTLVDIVGKQPLIATLARWISDLVCSSRKRLEVRSPQSSQIFFQMVVACGCKTI